MCNRNAPYVPYVADCLLRQSVGVAGGKEISHYVLYRHKFVFCFVFFFVLLFASAGWSASNASCIKFNGFLA